MEPTLLVLAWIGGLASGSALVIAGVALITGHVVINPKRIDWSVGEGRMLGAIAGVQGLYVGAAALVTALQLAANVATPPVMWILFVPIGGLGLCGTFAVGRHHDARNPLKRYFT